MNARAMRWSDCACSAARMIGPAPTAPLRLTPKALLRSVISCLRTSAVRTPSPRVPWPATGRPSRHRLVPRYLKGIGQASVGTDLLGQRHELPFGIAPIGLTG